MAVMVLDGNLTEGFKAYGPYSTYDDAAEAHPGDTWIMEITHKPNWYNNGGQYPRLIDELLAAGVLIPKVVKSVCESMDVTKKELEDLLDRASDDWTKVKAAL